MKLCSLPILVSLLLLASLSLAACANPPSELPTPTEQPASRAVTTAIPEVGPQPTSLPSTPAVPRSEPLEFVDGLGRTVELATPAQRIVSMAPSNTEDLFAIGAGGQVVGRDEFSDYPAEAPNLPSIGGGFGDYNNEAIVELRPDLVLAAEINTPEQVKTLEDLGLTVYLLPNPTTLQEMYDNLLLLGRMTAHETEASDLVAALSAREMTVLEKIATATEKPTVYYELDNTDSNAPYTVGPGTFIDTLINSAGGRNIIVDLKDQYVQVSVEELLVRNPEIILLGDAAYGVTPESVLQRPGWEEIAAVQNQRVYSFDDNLVSRPGPRLVDGLEQLARLLHPDLFEE